MNLFHLNSVVLALLVAAVLAGSVATGVLIGRRRLARGDDNHGTVGVVQGALLGLVGLLLAFGLSMAVGRYETRRGLVVQEANDIGTTYLRAQLLPEPQRTASLDLLKEYGDAAIVMADLVPGSDEFVAAAEVKEGLQNELWAVAGEVIADRPQDGAPKLYIEVLNDTIDTHTDRVASLGNRVPPPVMWLELLCSALALGAMGLYLTMLGRKLAPSFLTAAVLGVILLVSFDLDRPERGIITVPSNALIDVRASMDEPPAAAAPD
ncbi:MAG: hypothetical protein RL238_2329 [Actinomycetota bacterium]|jgi:hypothetical protein